MPTCLLCDWCSSSVACACQQVWSHPQRHAPPEGLIPPPTLNHPTTHALQIDVTFTGVGDKDLPEGSFTAAARVISPTGEQRCGGARVLLPLGWQTRPCGCIAKVPP